MTLSEKQKMLAGELYRSTDPELQAAMAQAQQQLRRLNVIANEDAEQRFAILHAMLGQIGSGTQVKSPFSCDYGLHIRIGRNGFVNYGCVFLDCNLITIGDDAQIGPGVHIYTAFHPVGCRGSTQRAGGGETRKHRAQCLAWGTLRHLSGRDDWRQQRDWSRERCGAGHSSKPSSSRKPLPGD